MCLVAFKRCPGLDPRVVEDIINIRADSEIPGDIGFRKGRARDECPL